jgi:hypothetical protein
MKGMGLLWKFLLGLIIGLAMFIIMFGMLGFWAKFKIDWSLIWSYFSPPVDCTQKADPDGWCVAQHDIGWACDPTVPTAEEDGCYFSCKTHCISQGYVSGFCKLKLPEEPPCPDGYMDVGSGKDVGCQYTMEFCCCKEVE